MLAQGDPEPQAICLAQEFVAAPFVDEPGHDVGVLLVNCRLFRRQREVWRKVMRWRGWRRKRANQDKNFSLVFHSSQQPEQPVENGNGMGRTAGDIDIHRQQTGGAVVRLGGVEERPAVDRTGPAGDDDLRFRYRRIGFQERLPHVFRDRAGDEHAVGVAGAGNELDAEPAQVEGDGGQHVGVGFAAVAPSCRNLPEFQ